jgi:hypothetical protein
MESITKLGLACRFGRHEGEAHNTESRGEWEVSVRCGKERNFRPPSSGPYQDEAARFEPPTFERGSS